MSVSHRAPGNPGLACRGLTLFASMDLLLAFTRSIMRPHSCDGGGLHRQKTVDRGQQPLFASCCDIPPVGWTPMRAQPAWAVCDKAETTCRSNSPVSDNECSI